MNERDANVMRLFDRHGELYGVMISPELWRMVERKIVPTLEQALDVLYPTERPEPFEDLVMFKDYWDFRYPYVPDVHCDHCGAATEDWENDPEKPFRLRNATLSGMLVFKCRQCGSNVRKKHFKDHVCFEFTPPGCGCGS